MFRYLPNFYLQPFPVLLFLLGEEAIDVLSFFYCQFRFQAKDPKTVIAVHQLISITFRSVLLFNFNGITNNKRMKQLVRCVGGALYGACHYVVLINIFDRNFQEEGIRFAFTNTLYLGFETLMPLVYIFGFKLRHGLFALHDLEWCPKKYMILGMIFTGIVGAMVSLISVVWVGWDQLGRSMCLAMMCVRGLNILVTLFIFLVKYRSVQPK